MAKSSIEGVSPAFLKMLEDVAEAASGKKRPKGKISLEFADTATQSPDFVGSTGLAVSPQGMAKHAEVVSERSPLVKSVLNVLNGGREDSIERLAFETNPYITNIYQGLYRRKLRLLPDEMLKRISIQDDLVAAIVNTRSNQIAAFGRPQPDRFSTGYKIELDPGESEHFSDEEKKEWQARIARAEKLILTCGQTRGYDDYEGLGFGQYLFMTARNAVVFGRCATEVIYAQGMDGQRKFHSFRPMDAGTIYRAANLKEAAQKVREEALHILETVKHKKLRPEKYMADEYPWVQCIEGRPMQAFVSEECLVHNFYPCTDIELDGYPITPLDTVIAAVTMHINITTHNKLYFQNGRASRGMLVIKSDDVDSKITAGIRQQFMASINSVSNSWRMPVFGVGTQDDIQWMPIDNSTKDMEYQYLSDSNARTILSAFQMSPEEIPGYSHLSRGTNSQSISECLSLDSMVYSGQGYTSIGKLLGDAKEVNTPIWDGSKWTEGRVFLSGVKKLMQTSVSSGVSIQTSPDHRFQTVDAEGNLAWTKQQDLAVGDFVGLNAVPVKATSPAPKYKGREIDEALMELLGWSIGDGTMVGPRHRAGAQLHLFYHHEREVDIWEKHKTVLEDWDIGVKHQKNEISPDEAEEIKIKYGFKSVAPFRLKNVAFDTDFVRWLLGSGFTPSSRSKGEGKTIPASYFTMPINLRQAFLRGLFSADGGKLNTTGAVALTIQADSLREQVRHMLLGLGIRTSGCKGVLRESFGVKKFSNKLFIKDRREFWNQIGFVQPYKQLSQESFAADMWTQDDIPQQMGKRFLAQCIQTDKYALLPKKQRDNIKSCVRSGNRRCSVSFVAKSMKDCGLVVPAELTNVHYERVVELKDLQQEVEMADVEMFSDSHTFVGQGFLVHNSNTEYQLEAHRDVGIRPLMGHIQNHVNQRILPLIDKELSAIANFKLLGLDAETAEKESVRLQTDLAVHMTMNEVLEKVEKKAIEPRFGGQFLLNPQWQQVLDKYVYQGDIMEKFFHMKGASQDPSLKFINNPMWFQWQQLLMQQQQMQQQAQAEQQQAQQQQQQDQQGQGELTQQTDQLRGQLGKSEKDLTPSQSRLLLHQSKVVDSALEQFQRDSDAVLAEILEAAGKHLPKKKD